MIYLNSLDSVPECPRLIDGWCTVAGSVATPKSCSLCKEIGPFCGKEVNQGQLQKFKYLAKSLDSFRNPPLTQPKVRNDKSISTSLKILSVVITSLNESNARLNQTIKSIRQAATPAEVEIIVVDDNSTLVPEIEDKSVILVRNSLRLGCAPSRHMGATFATHKYLLFTDAHMIYEPNWFNAFLVSIKNAPSKMAICGTCLGLDDKRDTLEKNAGEYNGAKLSIWEESENQVLEGKWIPSMDGDMYPISCMMGAIYFIDRHYFLSFRGLSDLIMWGSDEPCLALKILQTGGEMRISKTIRAGHFFRDNPPYNTQYGHIIYNKIRMAKTLLPDELAERVINKLPKDFHFNVAMNIINNQKNLIEEHSEFYKSIFTVPIEDICKNFNIRYDW